MAFAFALADETLQKGLRRIAAEQIDLALALAADTGGAPGPRIHDMRKAVKKLRALLRLLAPVMAGARAENALLRDAANGISATRDAEVMALTLQDLLRGADLDPDGLGSLQATFERARQAAAQPAALEPAIAPFATALADAGERARHWRIKRQGFAALAPGLAVGWDAARRAQAAALRHDEDSLVHEWRKRAKDHWYQARLLRPLWPQAMDPHIAAADQLGETLGLWHDIAVLRAALHALDLPPPLLTRVQDLAQARQTALMTQAAPLGRRLFAGKSRALVARASVWWQVWQDQGGTGAPH